MKYSVLVDFGSTYTKVVCVDMGEGRVVHTDKFPSTVHTDASVCLGHCFDSVREKIGDKALKEALKLSSSSAAGGLRMTVIGLSETLSYTAGKNCAYGAGGKIINNYFGSLTSADAEEIAESKPEILLLCGGYERGNRTAVLHNAEILAESGITVPVIYAGNSAISQDIRSLMKQAGKECFLVRNIIPNIGELDTEDAEALIRNLFMKRITNMKGLSKVQAQIGEVVMPTPAAVLAAGTLLSQGTASQEGLGQILMVDVGGATTDVYSFCPNKGFNGAKLVGAPEPDSKRTVEGDMGMRESSICIAREIGIGPLAEGAEVSEGEMERGIQRRITETSCLPDSPVEQRIDDELARRAIQVSVRRHAGHIEHVNTGGGVQNQIGKNITEIETVIGTGGVIVNHRDPASLMKNIFLRPDEPEDVLVPRKSEILVDRDYVLFAAGLLKDYDDNAALSIMKKSVSK